MTREQFLDVVREPHTAAALPRHELADLVQQFPYCQPLRMLLLRQLSDQESVNYEQQLRVTAAYVPDRSKLFQLIRRTQSALRQHESISEELLVDTAMAISREESPEVIYAEEITTLEPALSETYISPIAEEETLKEVEINEEQELTPQQIVEQRLRELNLVKEEPVKPSYESLSFEEEVLDEAAEKEEISSEEVIHYSSTKPEIIIEQIQDSSQEEIEEKLFEQPVLAEATELNTFSSESFKQPEHSVFVEAKPVEELPHQEVKQAIPVTSEKEPEEVIDPLEKLILEGIQEDRRLHADYFAETGISTDQVIESPSAEQAAPVMSAAPLEHSAGEIHSFSEWLSASKKAKALEEKQELSSIVEEAVQSEKKEVPVDIQAPIAVETKAEAIAETSSPKAAIEIKPSVQEVKTAKPEIRLIYRKGKEAEKVYQPISELKTEKKPEPVIPEAIQTSPLFETPVKVPEKEPFKPSEPLVEEPIAPTVSSESIRNAPIPDIPKPRVNAGDLIENFIKEEPRISQGKSAFYSPVNMAKRSLQEPDDLVTETLARIYAQQGNFQKAIVFYEKLALKFPEKSRYFAALIDELKQKNNS